MNSIYFDDLLLYPSKVVCIGRNYHDHIRELKNETPEQPVIFIKPNSAICSEIYADPNTDVDYEGEIVYLVIAGNICGVGFGLDLTKRKIQTHLKNQGLPWERAKAFDGSAVFSHFVSYQGDLNSLKMELYINDRLVQQGSCSSMISKPLEFLTEVKKFMSLEDGDLLMTGTPKGVGPISVGERFYAKLYTEDQLLLDATWIVK